MIETPDTPLADSLRGDDAQGKRALVIASAHLADSLGLTQCERFVCEYPEYCLENLSFLEASFDFLVSDQLAFRRPEPLTDVASETARVLRSGGVFAYRLLADTDDPTPFRPWFDEITVHRQDAQFAWISGRRTSASAPAPTVLSRRARPVVYIRTTPPRPARFGLVTCARNEGSHLLEWIAYHKIIGFENILIYDNESNDATAEILGPLSRAGVVDAVYWPSQPGANKQASAFNDAVLFFKRHIDWVAFLDVDEFLVFESANTLEKVLSVEDAVSAIAVPWRVFGSSSMNLRERGTTLERFTKASDPMHPANKHVKSIARLRDVGYMNIHVPQLTAGRIVDVGGSEVSYETRGLLDQHAAGGRARVNHYFTRSWEEFESKRLRGRGAVAPEDSAGVRSPSIFRDMDLNDVDDLTVQVWVPAVKAKIEQLRELLQGP